jgi:hypothetical protein
VAIRVESLTSDTEGIATAGYFTIRPSKPYVAGGQWVQDVWPNQTIPLDGTVKTVFLDPLPDTPYELYAFIPQGRGRKPKEITEFRIVAGAGPVAWETLVQVDGPTGSPVLTDVVDARLDALEASLGGISGGASTLASITNMSPFARLLNTDTTAGAMQTRLGVPPTASPTFTGNLAAVNVSFSGTVSMVDGSLSIADTSGLQGALDGKAPLASPVFTGNPTAPTPTAGDNDTSIATTAFVTTAVAAVSGGGGAPINSPAFTGNPTAPTPSPGDNDTSIATTAFVTAAVALVPSQSVIDDLTTLVTSLTARVQELEENGANMAAITGAAAARNNPLTGTGLNTGSVVTWLVDGTAPTNAVTGDIVLNRVSI